MNVLQTLHDRHKIVRDRYGHTVAHASHVGEGCYLGSALWLDHQFMFYVYGALFVLWLAHTIVLGLEG